ncbi:MAG: hypothetical protein RIC36_15360 [Rhodospirillales bacterium]
MKLWRYTCLPAVLLGVLLLGGCAGLSLAGLAGTAEVASVVNTDKTLTDHVASSLTGRDCSTIKVKTRNQYCIDPNSIPPAPEPVYCYRSLGDITCYREPNPYADGATAVVPPGQ